MRNFLDHFPNLANRPVPNRARFLLLMGAALLVVAIFLPLWQIHLVAPQYQEGLDLYIYSHKLQGGNAGQDISEINSLNRYIGMQPIQETDFVETRLMPFILGGFALMALRAALVGQVMSIVDLFVLFVYFGAFSMWRFYYLLSTYASNLDPEAKGDVEPFTPAMIGKDEVGGFIQYGYPREGSFVLLVVALCFAGALWMGISGPFGVEDVSESPAP